MTLTQYYLAKIAEECNEVAQRALKAMQFGVDEVQEGQLLTNFERLRGELCDLLSVTEMLEAHTFGGLLNITRKEREAKKAKVAKYLSLSRSCGMVEGE